MSTWPWQHILVVALAVGIPLGVLVRVLTYKGPDR